jgi:glycoprotein endo-alpha-1,2-mannosidase
VLRGISSGLPVGEKGETETKTRFFPIFQPEVSDSSPSPKGRGLKFQHDLNIFIPSPKRDPGIFDPYQLLTDSCHAYFTPLNLKTKLLSTMKPHFFVFLIIFLALAAGCKPEEGPVEPEPDFTPQAVSKTNNMKLYMHYMPWFQSQEVSGFWGSHWTMANKNPENILPNGNREIAAHYYPLIGPYDSGDPWVIEYHVLLMKYAGIDGILIDWYGSHDVLDYRANLNNSNKLIKGIRDCGLQFSLVYEEFTAEEVGQRTSFSDIDAAKQDIGYIQTNYLRYDEYIRINDQPLLLTFGPRYFRDRNQWTEILGVLSTPPVFLPLWGFTPYVGTSNASGEFSWVDFEANLPGLDNFYQSTGNDLIIGSAYPGFHDYYVEGGWGTSFGFFDHQDGQTLSSTLAKASEHQLDYLQFVTWNDFGEGTMIEPTQEFGFQFLEQIQDFAGVSYEKSDLETIYTYYLKRKEYKGNADAYQTLDEVFGALIELRIDTAKSLLSTL